MDSIKRIIKLSKDIAISILNKKKFDSSQIESVFSNKDTKDIIAQITHSKTKKERAKHVKYINDSKDEDWAKIKPIFTKKNKKKHLFFYKYAAILILFLSLGYFFFGDNKLIPKQENSVNNTSKNSDNIILELENGNKEIITANGNKTILNKNGKIITVSNGEKLSYSILNKKNNTPKKLVYNKLNIPYGKIFQVALSDGTKVYLNSGSSLKYPVSFIEGEKRLVFLKGEAYFDVKKDKEHPFIINTNQMNIEVLGTKFNVSSYPEDAYIKTVLVEGSVAISSKSNKTQTTLLKPGQKANWEKLNGHINIKSVNTSIYTAWINGKVVFNHTPFKKIIKKLERHYNVSIENKNVELAKQSFTASFDIETLDQVLQSFSKSYPFNYKKTQNKITIE